VCVNVNYQFIVTVADLQRRYRSLVDKIKKTGEPMVVINNGDPDVVVMDVATYNSYTQKLKELQEENLLRIASEGLKEYKAGKTIILKKGQKLLDLINW